MDEQTLNVDLKHLTVEEIEAIEEKTGAPIDTLADPAKPKGTMLRAIGYTVRRRTDPDFTWEAAGKLKVELAEEELPPTDAAG